MALIVITCCAVCEGPHQGSGRLRPLREKSPGVAQVKLQSSQEGNFIHFYRRIGKEKRCLKFLKKRIGSHDLAKKKREEMQAVLQAMRKKPAA